MRRGPGGVHRWALGLTGWLACAGAWAQLSGSVAVDSDYRSRGLSLSNSKPALRAAVNYDASFGGYAGLASATVESVYHERHVQLVPYAGYVLRLAPERSVELGATFAHVAGDSAYDYAEAYTGVSATNWHTRVFYSPNYVGQHVRTLYAELDFHASLGTAARVFAHAGALTAISAPVAWTSRSRGDLRIGSGWSFGDLDLQLSWSGATRGGPDLTIYRGRRTGFVVGATCFF